jgi:hypothetical protein
MAAAASAKKELPLVRFFLHASASHTPTSATISIPGAQRRGKKIGLFHQSSVSLRQLAEGFFVQELF